MGIDEREHLVQRYQVNRLDEQTIAMRVAKEFKDGDAVNLGRGLPSLVGNYVPPGIDIYWHAENGILGYGEAYTLDEWEEIDMGVHNASNEHVRERPGMVTFDFSEAFNMLRGRHLDAGVLGGFQVSERGDLANWAFEYPVPPWGIGIGGAFELVIGPKRCIVAITHLDRNGKPKIVKDLSMPVTGAPGHVDLIVSDLAVIKVVGPKGKKEGLLLKEIAPGWTVEELKMITEGRFEVSPDLKEYEL